MKEASFYPPHMLDSFGNPSPSALVPFCAFKGNMNLTGEYIPGINFPVCNKFKPTIQDGQTCHALDINSVIPKDDAKTKRGIENGILIAIDTDQRTAFQMEATSERTDPISGRLRVGKQISRRRATITISSLEKYTDTCKSHTGGCGYKMTTLKKMTGTDSFLGLSDDVKDCQIESKERCKNRKLFEKTQQMCGCLPWALKDVESGQVSVFN